MPGKIIEKARRAGRNILFEDESKSLLAAAGIPVVECRPAGTEEEAVALAGQAGYPAVLKVRSAAYIHKSDSGGVRLNLAGPDEVRRAYREIISGARRVDPEARVTVQRMAEPGVEVIAGATTDPHFGAVVMFGMGGVFTELLDDACFRLVPIGAREAGDMVRSLEGSRLLQGYRNIPPADLGALENILVRVSDLMQRYPEIAEMDLNPVAAYPSGALVLDARVKLK